MMKRIFISVGDPSGDIHGARLMAALKAVNPEVSFIGLGGNAMIREGLKPIVSIDEISVVGFWEVAKKYTFFKKLLNKCKTIISDGKTDAFVPIDYPGFNIRLASYAKQNSVPTIYYIAPQLWAWGKERAVKLAQSIDKLLVVFPFEEEFFGKFGIDAEFVGHPLLDDPAFDFSFPSFDERENRILFLPGSRKQEVLRHLPIINKTADILNKELPDYTMTLAKSSNINENLLSSFISVSKPREIVSNARDYMKKSKAGVIKTGTSTLETALCGLPFVMFYKTSFMSYQLGKHLVNLPFISMPNILRERFIVRELIQKDASPKKIAAEILKLIEDKELYNSTITEFKEVRKMLGMGGASENAANIISGYIS